MNEEQQSAFASTRQRLLQRLKSLVRQATVPAGDVTLVYPCTSSYYPGLWPDDFLYPFMADPSLADVQLLQPIADWLSESILDLPQVPDRVEADGLAILSPGWYDRPHSLQMPLHLPAAWTRLVDYFEHFGVVWREKRRWAELIARSFDLVPFSRGLAYVDPQQPRVGFGFHDTVLITGWELMSSLVVARGLERAARLFADEVSADQQARWRARASGVKANLHRLFDGAAGGFLAGSRSCKQVNLWGSGLAWGWAAPPARQAFGELLKKQGGAIFRFGMTRQVVEPGGWERLLPPKPGEQPQQVGHYMNGGHWSVGTAYVLPALAEHDPAQALTLAEAMLAGLEQFQCAEWVAPDGSITGPAGFLAAVAMPALALRAIAENKPLIDYF